MLNTIFSIGLLQLVGLVVGALRSKVFASLLGPAGFGVVATIDQLVMSAAQFGNLSVPFAALKFLSKAHSESEERFWASYASFLKVMIGLAIGATLLALLAIPMNLSRIDSQLATFGTPVTIALLGIPAVMLQMYFANVLAARQQSRTSVVFTSGLAVLSFVVGGIGCVLGGIRGIYLATVPSAAIVMVLLVMIGQEHASRQPTGTDRVPSQRLRVSDPIVTTSFYAYFAVISASAMMLTARYVSIVHLSAEAAGLLQACIGVALSIGAILGPANAIFFTPHVNRSIPSEEKIAAADMFLPRMALIFSLGALPIILFPATVLRILYSGQFTTVADVLPWFIAWQCIYHLSNVYQQLLIGLDDIRGYAGVTVTGNLVTSALAIMLVSEWGLLGIGAAFVLGAMLTGLLTMMRVRRRHRISVPRGALTVSLFAVASIALVTIAVAPSLEFSLTGLGIRVAVAATYLTTLWLALPKLLNVELMATWQRVRGRKQ